VDLSFTRFTNRFSVDQLETVWQLSGVGFAAGSDELIPFPGASVMVKFLRPIPGSWRDILRRAVRTSDRGAALVLMLALLRMLCPHPRPAVRRLSSVVVRLCPQIGHGVLAPTRGSPLAAFALPMPGVPPT
jgi:hypothetical protein